MNQTFVASCENCVHWKKLKVTRSFDYMIGCMSDCFVGLQLDPEEFECEISHEIDTKKLPNPRVICEAAMSGIPGRKERAMAAQCPRYEAIASIPII